MNRPLRAADAVARTALFVRTARQLHPGQVAHRLRLAVQRRVLALVGDLGRSALTRRSTGRGWPPTFVAIDAHVSDGYPTPEANAEGRFQFLNQTRDVGVGGWHQPGSARLWRFHLHYMEWLWSLAAHPDRLWARASFRRLWDSWRADVPFGHADGWSPYVASLRSWAMCGVYPSLVQGSDMADEFVESIALHAGFVRTHIEDGIGGNHVIKNLKALVGAGVFLGDDRLVRYARRRLAREISRQILSDGGHFERSPSYHAQVLGDLIDVGQLLHTAAVAPVSGLDDAVDRMRVWLGVMLMPDGDVPLFNDCILLGEARIRALAVAPPPLEVLVVLEPSGYVVMRPSPRLHLVADIGVPCPPALPPHAHADCLSFELAVDGCRSIVDTGTSTYQPGTIRDHERSTAAHNTVEVDGADQTEVWGAFRAGRRATPTLHHAWAEGDVIEVKASHDGYRRLRGRPVHVRTFRVEPTMIEIHDQIQGKGRHSIRARLHVAPDVCVTEHKDGALIDRAVVVCDAPRVRVQPPGADPTAYTATSFGVQYASAAVVAESFGNLPLEIRTVISVEGDESGRTLHTASHEGAGA